MKVQPIGFRLTAFTVLGVIGISIIGWHQTEAVGFAGPTPSGAIFVRAAASAIPSGSLGDWEMRDSAVAAPHLALSELRRMFEAHLSAASGKSTATITQEIIAEIERSVVPPNIPKAKRIFGLYLEFKRELLDMERSLRLTGQGGQDIRKHMQAMQELRKRYFSADEIQAMFGSQGEYDMGASARSAIGQDLSPPDEQQQEKIATLNATMSADLRGEREAQPVVLEIEEKVYAMRVNGASDDEVYRLRANQINPQAATRMAALDLEEAQWTSRIAQYLTVRNQILETPETAADPDHQAALLGLQHARFTENERRRLPAYEQ